MKQLKNITTFVLALCLFLGGTINAQAAKNFKNLSFVGGYAERHPTPIRVWFPFLEETKKQFNGELSFDYFNSNLLFPETEAFDAINDGRADFGVVRAGVFPGSMNLMGVVDLPGLMPNALVGSIVAQEVVEKFPEVRSEFPKNAEPYVAWTSASYQIHTIKPVKSFQEFQGKKIIVWDATSLEAVKAMGANPIRLPGTDSYLALSKGMADGVYCPSAALRSMKINEGAKHHLIINMGVTSFNIFAYKPLWDSFPDNMREWLTAEGGMKMAIAIGKSLEDGQADDIEWMKGLNNEFYYIDDAERDKFVKPLGFFKERWVADCEKRGFKNAREILKFTEERAAFHLEEMRKGTYGKYNM